MLPASPRALLIQTASTPSYDPRHTELGVAKAGIGLLVALCKRIRSTRGAFSVQCGEGIALKVLQVSGLIDFLEVESETESLSTVASKFAAPASSKECSTTF